MKSLQQLESAVSEALYGSGLRPGAMAVPRQEPDTFGNLVVDFRLPGWTLRVVRDRGLYELWFQTERGKGWHDFQHLLSAISEEAVGEVGSFSDLKALQKFLARALPRLKDRRFDEQLEARLQRVREKAAEENLREIFGPDALARSDTAGAEQGSTPTEARERQSHGQSS